MSTGVELTLRQVEQVSDQPLDAGSGEPTRICLGSGGPQSPLPLRVDGVEPELGLPEGDLDADADA